MKRLGSVGTGICLLTMLLAGSSANAGPLITTNLYFTGFEYLEGFNTNYVIAGQNGWEDYADNNGVAVPDLISNGLVNDVFSGLGQQGWIGGKFVDKPVQSVSVWHPLIVDPVPTSTPVVKISLLMAIEPATTNNYDFFRWSVYNSQTNRLFSLDFENATGTIAYLLDNGTFHDVPTLIGAGTIHHLELAISFAANQWSAWLDDAQMVTNAPVSTGNLRRSLGELDAVWLPNDPNNLTRKRMYFDNLQLSAESVPSPPVPPTLLTLGRTTNGFYALRLLGDLDAKYALDYSVDTSNWIPLKTNIAVDGSFDFVDTNAPVTPVRIFRARLLSP